MLAAGRAANEAVSWSRVFTLGTWRSSCFLERRCLRPIMRFAPTIWLAKVSSEDSNRFGFPNTLTFLRAERHLIPAVAIYLKNIGTATTRLLRSPRLRWRLQNCE